MTGFDSMEPAEVEPFWASLFDGGYQLELDDEVVRDREGALVGMLTKIEEGVGKNNSRLYTLHTEVDERPIKLWGSAHIDNQVDEIPLEPPYELGVLHTGEERETEQGDMTLFDVRYSE